MVFLNFGSDSFEFCSFRTINEVVFIDTNNRFVRWNLNNVQSVNLLEFFCFGEGGTRHTGELVVEAEEVLEGNCSEGHRLFANKYAFLCLDSLMETFVIAATLHETTSVFVDDENFARFGYDVIFIAMEESLCTKGLLEVVNNTGIISRI